MNRPDQDNNVRIISVIVPYYNNTHLFECLDSILIQRYPAIEIIIADDGSDTDRSEEIRKYIDKHRRENIRTVRILRSEVNKGTVYNINHAILASQGDPVFTLAADDVFYDEKVLDDWTNAFNQTDADVVIGYRSCCDEQLKPVITVPNRKQTVILKSGQNSRIWKQLCRDNFIFGCTTARSARCIEQYGLIPECYRLIEDYPMNLRWCRMGAKIELIDRIVVSYRDGGTSNAENLSEYYLNDTRAIYENEVFPFVKCKLRWKLHLQWMIRMRIRLGRYRTMRKRHDSLAWNILCHFLFPEIVLRYIQTKINEHGESPIQSKY